MKKVKKIEDFILDSESKEMIMNLINCSCPNEYGYKNNIEFCKENTQTACHKCWKKAINEGKSKRYIPVLDAVHAFMNGKTIACDYYDYNDKSKEITKVFEAIDGTKGIMDDKILSFYMITEGKWYIKKE